MKPEGKLLVVDDNKAILSALRLLMSSYFEEVVLLSSPNTIISTIKKHNIDVILLDMNFTASINSGNEGLYWLEEIKKLNKNIPVVVFTAYADIELAVEAIKRGASDFIVKPWDNTKLISTLQKVYKDRRAVRNNHTIVGSKQMYWGETPRMLRLRETIEKVAVTDANILITGENGTGKEVLTKELCALSMRSQQPLITVDMGAITETLFESELFGHAKGSFTGATGDRVGKFEAANGGTLFLDEIANLPYHLQAKLLTVLQSKTVVRVGSNTPIGVDVRLVCATNQNLEKMVAEGKFREDLFYRINTIQIELPSLRNRQDDIIPLANRFLRDYANRYQKPINDFGEKATKALTAHLWAGNIRELQHTIEKAVILCEGSKIEYPDLLLKAATEKSQAEENGDSSQIITLEKLERQTIKLAIERNAGNMSSVAQDLGVTRQTLYNKIKRYKL
ncbi:MAG: sigma-54 dependent transcriptional regulator [Rikenellaceae bacterium]